MDVLEASLFANKSNGWGPRMGEIRSALMSLTGRSNVSGAKQRAGDGGESRTDLSRLARSSSLTLAGGVAGGLLGYILVLVVTRGLGAGRAGVFFEAIALFSIVSVIAELGADDGVVRMIPRYLALGRVASLRRLLAVSLIPVVAAGFGLGLLMFVFASQLSDLFVHEARAHDALVPYIRNLAPFVALSAASVTMLAGTRGFGSMTPFVLVDNVGKPAVRPLSVLIVIMLGLSGNSLALAWALPIAAGFVVASFSLARLVRRAESQTPWGNHSADRPGVIAGEFWRFASPRGVAGAFAIGLTWIDTLLVGGLRGVREAGIYAATTRYLLIGLVAVQAIQLAVAPLTSRLFARGETERAQVIYRTATQWLVIATWPVYLTLAIFGPVLLRVFGAEFVEGRTALALLSLAGLIVTVAGPSQMVLLMAGKSGWTLLNTVVSLGLNVVLNLILIPPLGIDGAALAWVASLVFNNLASVLELRLLLGLSPFGTGLLLVVARALACFGGIGLLVRTTLGPSWGAMLAFGLVATGLYAALLWQVRSKLDLPILADLLRPWRGGSARTIGVGIDPVGPSDP